MKIDTILYREGPLCDRSAVQRAFASMSTPQTLHDATGERVLGTLCDTALRTSDDGTLMCVGTIEVVDEPTLRLLRGGLAL